MSWSGGNPYGGGGGGASKFDGDPAYSGGSGGSSYGAPQMQQQYGAPPQQSYSAPQYSGGSASKFDGDPAFSVPSYSGGTQYDSASQYSAAAQYGGGGGGQYGGPQYGSGPASYQQQQPYQQQAPPYQQQQPPYQQGQPYGGSQSSGPPPFGNGPPPFGPGAPAAGHAPPYASRPNVPVSNGPGPHPVMPYAGGMQQPAAPGPQGQGTLSGRKRAVLCGCNYKGSSAQLNGCINDTKCMKYLLTTKFGFQDNDIRLLVDDHPNPACWPTRHNICLNIAWLTDNQQPGDDLFFHFSGHGSQEPDASGEETSGYNDTILPCDFKRAGQINDNELCQRLVNPLRQGVRLHAVIDACHSGSALDLPFRCKVKGGVPTWKSEYIEGRQRSHKGTAGGLAIQIAAAGDKETAADTSALSGGTSTGAATFAFIQAIEQHGTRITYGTLLLQMDKVLHSMGGGSSMGGMLDSLGVSKMLGGFSSGSKVMGMLESGLSSAGLRGGQTPQLSANYAFDVNTPLQM